MLAVFLEWLNAILRWAHIMVGFGWIGTSFYFIWLDYSLRRKAGMSEQLAGESWSVHGGGFYRVEKYKVAPEHLPEELHWFKYEAYFTFVTGFLLLAVIYYFGAHAFLIDRNKVDLTSAEAIAISVISLAAGWLIYNTLVRLLSTRTVPLAIAVFILIAIAAFFYHAIFTDRAAFLHLGAFIGTIMAASVFMVIIPNQRKVVASLMKGETPDPRLGMQAKQRSLHNNYLTLPVIFMMISNHYPVIFGHPWAPFLALGIVIAGGLVRHYFNMVDAGKVDWKAKAAIPASILLIIVLAVVSYYRPDRTNVAGKDQSGAAAAAQGVAFADVQHVVQTRCVVCHSATPSSQDFTEAPKGLMFDTPQEMKLHAQEMKQQAVLSDNMPLGNMTNMTPDERKLLGAWIDQGAKIP
ncbi:Uncharacterized membrane protein [Faunimonas pinastri]|uniref:Uncharacterized membrane protein n=1 Tax=Faunimonas pinastri TaxID=1855383 RepID=A0A1H9KXE6_9HYPH|nr:urate hydroxylase PuuD [Faunimonas pinastri]SER03728.1 Uncharacterized membrane protein [Faunimonas pinastri]